MKGEIYRITQAIEAALDVLEEVADGDSGEYIKRETDVRVGGATLQCLVYEIHPSRTVGRDVIAGGDWFERRN